MTRVTPGTRVRAAIVRASSPASAGVVFIFQLAAITTGRIDLIMPEATPAVRGRAAVAPARPRRLRGRRRRRVDARRRLVWRASRSSRSSARCTAERWRSSRVGDLGERGLRRLAPCRGDRAHRPRLLAQSAVGLERVDRRELPARRGHGALQVGRLGVEHPVELAAQAPRDLARLELEQRRAGPDPAEERR